MRLRVIEEIFEELERIEIERFEKNFRKSKKNEKIERLKWSIENLILSNNEIGHIYREIGNQYFEIGEIESAERWMECDEISQINDLENSVTQEEFDKIQENEKIKNENNLNENLRNILNNYKESEISGENKIKIWKPNSTNRYNEISIIYNNDNSYQYIHHMRKVNTKVSRISTIIKYIEKFLNE